MSNPSVKPFTASDPEARSRNTFPKAALASETERPFQSGSTGARPVPGVGKAAPKTGGVKKHLLGVMTTVAAVSVLGNVLMYCRFTTLRPLVTIGNHAITKREYLAVLDEEAGKQTLNKLVYSEIIRQAAARAHVTPTARDIDERLMEVVKHSPKLASIPEYKMREIVFSQIALENLRLQNVSATQGELERFYASHKPLFYHKGQVQAALVITRNALDAQTAVHLLQQNIDPGVIAKQPNFYVVGYNGYTIDSKTDDGHKVLKLAFSMKQGSTQTFNLSSKFLTIKIYKIDPPGVQPLSLIKDQVGRLVRLEKAPSVKSELARLYQDNKPSFEISKYETFFDDIEQTKT